MVTSLEQHVFLGFSTSNSQVYVLKHLIWTEASCWHYTIRKGQLFVLATVIDLTLYLLTKLWQGTQWGINTVNIIGTYFNDGYFFFRSAMTLFASCFNFLYERKWKHFVTSSKNFLSLSFTQQSFPLQGNVWEEGGSCSQCSTSDILVMVLQKKMIHMWMLLINESKKC